MKIHRVEIERFRGIEKLDWRVGGGFVCLVGPGDSTKSTILDAIDFTLSPRWNLQLDDTDFFDAKTELPITIKVTVGQIPEVLKSDAKFGLLARGWTREGTIRDEPEDDDEIALTVQLRVDPSLEASWAVVNDRRPDGKPITARDREQLGCARLGDFLDRHFAWGRGSVLSRLTGEADSLSGVLADAGRAARGALDLVGPERLSKLRKAAEGAQNAGSSFGVAASSDYAPRLDVQAMTIGVGGLSLHEGSVPLRRAGLGTRRLLAVAMQHEAAKAGGVTLIDEVEHGLEPHRIRHLVRQLRAPAGEEGRGPTFMTTHSPVALAELEPGEVAVVRARNGETQVIPVPAALKRIVLKASEAFFARRVLVCEGKTELGFCRRLDQWWVEGGQSFGLSGVALVNGGGRTEAPGVAGAMAQLGYPTALVGDTDEPLNPDEAALAARGVQLLLWEGQVAIEERIALDLPWPGVSRVIDLAAETKSEQSVRAAVAARLSIPGQRLAGSSSEWASLGLDELALRKAVGAAAKHSGWFKRVDLAEALATVVIDHFEDVRAKDLGKTIERMRLWAHSDG